MTPPLAAADKDYDMISSLLRTSTLLPVIAGALLGLSLACDPKNIGDESTTSDSNTGGSCTPGDEKPADDGCNTCTCDDQGEWACTLLGCESDSDGDTDATTSTGTDPDSESTDGTEEPPNPSDPTDVTSTTSTTDGLECEPGQEMLDPDGCNTCTCTDEGTWACTEIACEPPPVGACPVEAPMDDYGVMSAAIDGDVLLLTLEVGGGCEEHIFMGCWDGSFAESDPVQTWIGISHDAMNDPCDALLFPEIAYSLVPVKESWQAGYLMEHGTVNIHVDGWPQVLEYTF